MIETLKKKKQIQGNFLNMMKVSNGKNNSQFEA